MTDQRELISELSQIPRDDEGPVFNEPWEASAFALAVRLSEEGHFTWPEWVAVLIEVLRRIFFEEKLALDVLKKITAPFVLYGCDGVVWRQLLSANGISDRFRVHVTAHVSTAC